MNSRGFNQDNSIHGVKMKNEYTTDLNGVMYALFHVRNLEEVRANRYMYNIYEIFTKEYDRAMQEKTIDAIERALQSHDINKFCNLPHLPGTDEFKREYLNIVLHHLKKSML